MIKNIIFDIGRVLVDFDWEIYLNGFGFDTKKTEAIANATFAGPVWKELDRAVLTVEEIKEGFVARAPQYREDILKVFEGSYHALGRRDFAIPWIQELKAQSYNIYYLSNYSEWMQERSGDALDFLPYTDGGLFSYEVKQIKPDRDIYQSLIDRYPSIIPEESVFLDDSAENIHAARAFGLHGIIFENEVQAKTELAQLLKD